MSLILYVRTLAPGLLFGDPGEFQFAAWRFGLAHPTGYPLYLVLGGLWQHLLALFGMDPAYTLNLFSAVTAAGTVGLVYLLLGRWLRPGWQREPIAMGSALFLAVIPTFWSHALVAEVYALHALLLTLLLWVLTGAPRLSIHRSSLGVTLPTGLGSPFVLAALILGLALTHHRTSLFLAPGVAVWWLWKGGRSRRELAGMCAGLVLPQLLYLYVPLRSGPDASPWLYQALDGEVLRLYEPGVGGFIRFITGQVFAVSFLGPAEAWARLPQMVELWRTNVTWVGLLFMAVGLVHLFRNRRWDVLLLTLPFALMQQVFNLFYGIGDIFAYYMALYLVGAIWAAFGAEALVIWLKGVWQGVPGRERAGQIALLGVMALLPAALLVRFYAPVDQSGNVQARAMWQAITAALPDQDAILISNDRNEIVPLYYLQAVEEAAPHVTGLFPLITQEPRFAHLNGVIHTALGEGGGRPVWLIKPMPGVEAAYDVAAGPAPLVQVLGNVSLPEDVAQIDTRYGPLTLLGLRRQRNGDEQVIDLYWRVEAGVEG
ncbi:MAG: DUF2723 domain-containing protein, partial [Caldilineae bacterium]